MDRKALKPEVDRLYWKEKLCLMEISSKLNIGYGTVSRLLLKKRTLTEALYNRQEQHPRQRTGKRTLCSNGYYKLYNPSHPSAFSDGSVYEHKLVWEEYNQKPLPKGWAVHHINGIRGDNRPENLAAMPQGKHKDIIPMMARKIRQLEIENRQLRKSLDNKQMLIVLNEN